MGATKQQFIESEQYEAEKHVREDQVSYLVSRLQDKDEQRERQAEEGGEVKW